MDAKYCSLVEYFSDLSDPRVERSRRHKLIDTIVIGVVGTLCGAESWEDIQMIANDS